jgi:fatty-acyl-CoA synthase
MMMLWDQLTSAETLSGQLWAWDGDGFRESTYGQLFQRARRVAGGLGKRGVRPGDTVAAVITNGIDVGPGILGAWFSGAQVASLPIIARGMSIPSYVAQLNTLCRQLNAKCLLAEERFLQFMPSGADVGCKVVGFGELATADEIREPAPPPLGDPIFVQYSSGTTAAPRGVMLSGMAIEAHIEMLLRHLKIDRERDIGYSWLPLSHDMGFFGCGMLSWYTGMRGVIAPPERFLQEPRSWFDDCAKFGATVTVGPPSAVAIATRAERVHSNGVPLQLRLCLIGAEQVDWAVLSEASDVFAARGLALDTFTTAYGLAEATLAVAIGDLDGPPRWLDVYDQALADSSVAIAGDADGSVRRLVSAGAALPGVSVRADTVGGGGIGELCVRGPANASGYVGDQEATADRFVGGEVRTADLGFVHDGQLYITGRNDDVVIVGGRNFYAGPLERELGTAPGIRKGNCAIIEQPSAGRARVVLVAETDVDAADQRALALRLRKTAIEQVGLPIDDCVFLPRGMLPKTPSGKVQRHRCRDLLATSNLGTRVPLTPSRR